MSDDSYRDPRELFIAFACIGGIIVTSVTGLPSIFRGEFIGKIIFLFSCILFINICVMQFTKRVQLSALMLVFTGIPYFLYLQITGGLDNTGALWSFVIPPCSIFLVGLRWGTAISIFYFAVSVLIITSGSVNSDSYLLNPPFFMRFVMIYVFILIGCLLNEFTREKNFSRFSNVAEDKRKSEKELSDLYLQLEKAKVMQSELSEKIGYEAQSISKNLIVESSQMANGSKKLAVGASRQASSLEEISSSVTEIDILTKNNSNNAVEANELSKRAIKAVENGVKQMETMVASMNDINEASSEISQIIKTIDDIAFQTNLLALNAAVEAARAGKHGKGFAVVAEEVRILASRCTKAASRTSDLIDSSVAKIESGNVIAVQTSEVLDDINAEVNDMGILVSKIARASKKQVQGIELVNSGLSDIEKVTVANAATADEAANSAEHLSLNTKKIQALLESIIDTFYDLQDSMKDGLKEEIKVDIPDDEFYKEDDTVDPKDIISLDDKEFGRY